MPSKWLYIFIVMLLYSVAVSYGNILSITYELNKSVRHTDDALLNFTELTGKYGYLSEEHKIVTDDGYILTAFRIARAKKCNGEKTKPPVVLMHGFLQSSDSWIDSGPNAGLAYLIADACYDIWLGNTRGDYYSREHIHLDPDKHATYWQFTDDDIGYYDLPALIDYVLDNTKSEKVNYIGFSQGAGTLYIMCSERPGYCDKVKLMIALAPSTRHIYTRSLLFRSIFTAAGYLEKILYKFDIYEFLANGDLFQKNVEFLCQASSVTEICKTLLFFLDSVIPFKNGSVTTETMRTLIGHFPAGTSVSNIAKYGQMLTSDEFVKFDYGKSKNLQMYGAETPPPFNLDAVTVPVVVIYGENDGIVDIRDVEWLISKLPQVIDTHIVSDPLWSYLDFTYSKKTNKLVFPKVHEYLYKYSYEYTPHLFYPNS